MCIRFETIQEQSSVQQIRLALMVSKICRS